MRRWALQVLIGAALLICEMSALAVEHLSLAPDRYASDDAWLCRPERQDACGTDVQVTVLKADGTTQQRTIAKNASAAIDCFYVYPTVSENPHGNSDMKSGSGEERAVRQQFAPFSSVCRPFAPLYRQVTLAGLMSRYASQAIPTDEDMAYGDVLEAWHHYVKYDNHGRGVVLIGHSQGARWLVRLIQQELDVREQRARLVSAVLLGWSVEVPVGKVIGGTFKEIPACTSGEQTNCVISFMSFRADSPPPLNSPLHFGYATTPGMEAICSDPVALSGIAIQSIFAVKTDLLGHPSTLQTWTQLQSGVGSPFVELDEILDARCTHAGAASFLAVSLSNSTLGLKPDAIPGDIVIRGEVQAPWGLHLDDANIAMGNLLSVLQMESNAFASERSAQSANDASQHSSRGRSTGRALGLKDNGSFASSTPLPRPLQ